MMRGKTEGMVGTIEEMREATKMGEKSNRMDTMVA
jgi:hypothetical protein